jgi:hypothetical protein
VTAVVRCGSFSTAFRANSPAVTTFQLWAMISCKRYSRPPQLPALCQQSKCEQLELKPLRDRNQDDPTSSAVAVENVRKQLVN